MRDLHVLIAGAGIGGLATAMALQRAGIRVSVYEQAPALGEVGAGLTLASNASRILRHLGLGAVLDDLAVIPGRGAVKHYRTGRTLVDIPRGQTQVDRFGAPYCQIHRNDLHQALVAAVQSADRDCLHLGCTLEDFGQDAQAVTAVFANAETARGDLLVGCDGIRSTVRARLFGTEDPRFTGYVAWRGLVPMERLSASLVVPDSAVWIGPGHFLTRYKIRRGELLNYIAIARTNGWVEEGWSVRSTVEALLAEFRDFEPTARSILMATPPDQCFKWGIFDRDPLPVWSTGRVTLLGDAAHPTTPFLGQGAAIALEDAMVLARAIVAAGSVAEALARYEKARVARANEVLLASRENGLNLTTTDPDRYDEETHRNEESLDLASYDAMTVPV
ncbi:MAG: FAD-dependent monooxygenase [Chromatiales bacterium]|nr:FAD-dependent monooxygenase [Chromatiales bacterium]